MRRALLLPGLLLAACGAGSVAAPPDAPPGPGDYRRALASGGLDRAYEIHVPPAWTVDAALPVLLAFHGAPMTVAQMRAVTRFDALADARGFVAVYPEAAFGDWNHGCDGCGSTAEIHRVDDVGFVDDLLARLERDLGIDRSRVWVAGFSNGGLFAQRLACDAAGDVAAFAVVAATAIGEEFVPPCRPGRPVPILFVHGTRDHAFPPEGRAFDPDPGTPYVRSIAATVEAWVARDGCAPAPVVTPVPDTAADGTTARRLEWPGCDGGARVALIAIEDGAHVWPGPSRDVDASLEALAFFAAAPALRRAGAR